jgi:hypothetical protein
VPFSRKDSGGDKVYYTGKEAEYYRSRMSTFAVRSDMVSGLPRGN